VSISYPEFRVQRCTRYRFRYSECQRCSDACPHEAITLSDSGAKIDETRCQNCALCSTACLTGAWAADAFKPIDILRVAIKQKEFSIACAPCGQAADAVVPCLGALDAGMIAYLGKRKIPLTLHGSQHCSECPHGAKGAAQLAANLEAAAQLCAAGDDDPAAPWANFTFGEAAPARATTPVHAARRQLFRRLVGRGVDAVVAGTAPALPQTPIADKAIRAGAYAGTEQRELLQIVCERKDGKPFMMRWHEALPLMRLALQPGCTTCEACFRACPTGAIQIVENPGDWALTFQADRCVGCAVCLEVCQPRVLDAEAEFDCRPGQPARVLHSLVKQRCNRCDRFFVSPTPEQTCKVCSDDQDAFSSIFG
jgi:energy-converting hydrogenase A subunit P